MQEKDVYRPTIREGLKALIAWGWTIRKTKEDFDATPPTPKSRYLMQSSMVSFHFHAVKNKFNKTNSNSGWFQIILKQKIQLSLRKIAKMLQVHSLLQSMSNTIGSSRESNPSRRICNLRASTLGHVMDLHHHRYHFRNLFRYQ